MELWHNSSGSLSVPSTMHNNHIVANRHHIFERSIEKMHQHGLDNHQIDSITLEYSDDNLHHYHQIHHQNNLYSLLSPPTTSTTMESTNLNNNCSTNSICLSESESQSSSSSFSSSNSSTTSSTSDNHSHVQVDSEAQLFWNNGQSATASSRTIKNLKSSTNNKRGNRRHNSRYHRSSHHTNRHHNHHQLPHQRHAANLRERKRMQSINDAFEGLRARIPTLPYEKRLSKVDTLRLAIGYIRFLADLVRTGGITSSLSGTNSNDTSMNISVVSSFHNRYQCCPPPPAKKILLKSQSTVSPNTDPDHQPTPAIHSLSWESDENKKPGAIRHGNILIAKVWTPEDPREASPSNIGTASVNQSTFHPQEALISSDHLSHE